MNHIKELTELNEKATPGPWRVHFLDSGSQYASAWAKDDVELTINDMNLIDAMKNSLPLWLNLAKAVEAFEASFSKHYSGYPSKTEWPEIHKVRQVLAKLRGEG